MSSLRSAPELFTIELSSLRSAPELFTIELCGLELYSDSTTRSRHAVKTRRQRSGARRRQTPDSAAHVKQTQLCSHGMPTTSKPNYAQVGCQRANVQTQLCSRGMPTTSKPNCAQVGCQRANVQTQLCPRGMPTSKPNCAHVGCQRPNPTVPTCDARRQRKPCGNIFSGLVQLNVQKYTDDGGVVLAECAA